VKYFIVYPYSYHHAECPKYNTRLIADNDTDAEVTQPAGAFTGTRDSWLLQDGIEDTTRLCNDFHVTARYKLSALLLLLLL